MSRIHTSLSLTAGLVLLITAISFAPVAMADEEIKIRVTDVSGRPGGSVAVVLSTSSLSSSSQPVRRGQADFFSPPTQLTEGAAGPFKGYSGSEVFAEESDAVARLSLSNDPGQSFLLEFFSLSDSINRTDGPLAVLFFELRDELLPGEVYGLNLDATESALLASDGFLMPVDALAGRLEILAPGEPYQVKVTAEDVAPGGTLVFSAQTVETIGLSSGQVAFRYDPAIAMGDPTVHMDWRFGDASFTTDVSQPGLVIVTVESPDASLNKVPGELIVVSLPTRSDVPPETQSMIWFDPELTWLLDELGGALPLTFESVEFRFDD